MIGQKIYDFQKKETIDLTNMSLEEIWNIRHNLDKNASLEIIIDRIIKRLPKAPDG